MTGCVPEGPSVTWVAPKITEQQRAEFETLVENEGYKKVYEDETQRVFLLKQNAAEFENNLPRIYLTTQFLVNSKLKVRFSQDFRENVSDKTFTVEADKYLNKIDTGLKVFFGDQLTRE
ncbi:hypothetical protein ZMTM_16340 [Methyloradius palustris]|uniref:Uncharacterized protein n=2 Tax=Methyloradius palustris TaxID=2778876 RepID=A0A8D5JM05_9PROT|nr:hypothetical protein ZMTM_16340 [Methyloradius palustris]